MGPNPTPLHWNGQATQAFLAGQMAEAKNLFAQVVAAAPDSGQAHYNYALSLNALGKPIRRGRNLSPRRILPLGIRSSGTRRRCARSEIPKRPRVRRENIRTARAADDRQWPALADGRHIR